MNPDPGHASRANGLDTLRAGAITLVFMYHYMAFASGTPTFGWGSVVGWTGVDLFFVLSGYLIANQIFAGLARGATLSLGSFYARRALRTLPVFWLVLALYFLFPGVMGGNPPPPLWRFLTFTQNIGLHSGTAFSHAWSLCIEEQFYLVLPLALAIGARYGFGRSQDWTLVAPRPDSRGVSHRTLVVFDLPVAQGSYDDPAASAATLRRGAVRAGRCHCDRIAPGGRAALLARRVAVHGYPSSAVSNQLCHGLRTIAAAYAACNCADTPWRVLG